jgi:hypothetical protein
MKRSASRWMQRDALDRRRDYPLSGDRASESFMTMLPGTTLLGQRTRHCHLDSRRPAPGPPAVIFKPADESSGTS